MTLPIDRTYLALVGTNQNPGNTFSSSPNKNAFTTAYNTIDELYGYVNQTLQGIYDANKFSRLGIINPMDPPFNAKGDGIADDRQALTNAYSVASINGYTVDLQSDKVYLINSKPGTASIFYLSNIKIIGRSTIKIGAIGDYDRVFTLLDDNVILEDFAIDENTTNNPMTDQTGSDNNRRITFFGWNVDTISKIEFNRLTIKDTLGIWQITLKANNVNIKGCMFEYATSGNPEYDRTAVYMTGDNWVVRDNNFIGSDIAHTCLETHGSNILVDHNTINDYDAPLYITNEVGGVVNEIASVRAINNTIKCREGVVIWMSEDDCNVDSIFICDNKIETTGDIAPIATNPVAGNNVVVNNVKINNNVIIGNTTTFSLIRINNTQGTTDGLTYNEFEVTNNIFMGNCIRVIHLEVQSGKYQVFKRLKIANNTFNIETLYSDYLIRMVDVPYGFKEIIIENNLFSIESVPTFTATDIIRGFSSFRVIGYGNTVLKNNIYRMPSGVQLSLSNNEGVVYLNVQESLLDMDIKLMTAFARTGMMKDIYDQWIQFSAGVPKIKFNGTAAPASLAHKVGDKVVNTTPTAGGYEGWVCVTAGTPGTFKGYGLIQT